MKPCRAARAPESLGVEERRNLISYALRPKNRMSTSFMLEHPMDTHEQSSPSDPSTTDSVAEMRRSLGLDDRSKWRRRAFIAAALVVIALLVTFFSLQALKPEASPDWGTTTATRGDIRQIVSATGTVEPRRVIDVGPEISGRVTEVLVGFNEEVEAGDVLARLDSDSLLAELEQAEASLAVANAAVSESRAARDEARQNAARAKKLKARGVLSKEKLESATTAKARATAGYNSAKASRRKAQAVVGRVRTDLAKAEIKAPINGVVLERLVEPGQTVAASLQTPVVFRIAENLAQMEVDLNIDEADVGQVVAGQTATFVVDAFPDKVFDATVRQLRLAPHVIDNVVTYEAVLDVDNSERLLRPGMTATANITTSMHSDVLRVPNSALRFTPPPSTLPEKKKGDGKLSHPEAGPPSTPKGQTVWVLRDNKPVELLIETGATDGRFTEVKKGSLDASEKILISVELEEAP